MKKYDKLMAVILSRENLAMALSRVRTNKGASGVDGMGVDELPAYLSKEWPRISMELATGSYRPRAVRGVEIPKANGGKRLLGIPTVLDRFIQSRRYTKYCRGYGKGTFPGSATVFAPIAARTMR